MQGTRSDLLRRARNRLTDIHMDMQQQFADRHAALPDAQQIGVILDRDVLEALLQLSLIPSVAHQYPRISILHVLVSNATGSLTAAALALMADAMCSLALLRSLTLTTSQPSYRHNAGNTLPGHCNVLATFLQAAAKHAAVSSLS